MPVVISIGDFTQIYVKKLFGYPTVRMKPVFGIAPEAFDTVDMVPSFGFPLLFADHDMIAPNRQRCVYLPFIGVVQTPRLGVSHHQFNDFFFVSFSHGENLDFPIPLKDSQHDDFPGGAPPAFPRPIPANRCFIAFYRSFKGFSAPLFVRTTRTYQPKEPFNRLRGCNIPKTQPVTGYSVDKQFNEFALRRVRQPTGTPYTRQSVSRSKGAALAASIAKSPTPPVSTFRASSHSD